MKTFSPELAAHLASGTTTLCRCFRIVRADETVLGFTDHDRALSFDGTDFEPATGLDAGETVAHAGLQVGGTEVSGALSLTGLDEADLVAGLFDNARVEVFLVNWADVAQRHLIAVGAIGEVSRSDRAFAAEVRGLAHALDQPRGRIFRATCDADLGDARCTIDLAGPDWRESATVIATDGARTMTVAAMPLRPSGLFDRGLLTFASGTNDGRSMEVQRHLKEGGFERFDLWQEMASAISPGDTFDVTAGCDKRFATCGNRFDNQENFRGFPHMPGNDFALSYARRDRDNDGGAEFDD